MLGEPLTFLAGADVAGVALDALVPITLARPSHDTHTRLAYCAVAGLLTHSRVAMPQSQVA